MRRIAVLGAMVLAMGCTQKDAEPAADTMAVAPAPMLNLADVAGTWSMKVMREGSDSVLLTYDLNATGTTEGWTFAFPNRPPVPVRVTAAGDSVTLDAGPYESALRPGIQVSTQGVARLQDGKLVGTTVATYASGPDSVVRLRVEGTRK